jgi:L-alanine-DL-glutamate epimerase-like enolase superfamily enzyme
MNPFSIAGGEVSLVKVPLKRPFVTALGEKRETVNAVLSLRLAGGAQGLGEASSSIVMKHLSPESLASALRGLLGRLRGRDARAQETLAAEAWALCGETPAAAAAFECAALEALLAQRGVPMAEWFGGALSRLETDMTLSALPPAESGEAAAEALEAGFRTLKIKVGTRDEAEDLARVASSLEAGRRLGVEPSVILDGNQGFTAEGALRFAEAALRLGARIALYEQPLPREKIRDLAWLRRRSPAPVAADESVRSPAEALAVLEADAADVINVKVAKLGLRGSRDAAAIARAAGKGLMIGCMQETARGLAPSVHLACGLGGFSFVDLDSDLLLAEGQPRGGFSRRGPVIELDYRSSRLPSAKRTVSRSPSGPTSTTI